VRQAGRQGRLPSGLAHPGQGRRPVGWNPSDSARRLSHVCARAEPGQTAPAVLGIDPYQGSPASLRIFMNDLPAGDKDGAPR
jgi:hypothetical protein